MMCELVCVVYEPRLPIVCEEEDVVCSFGQMRRMGLSVWLIGGPISIYILNKWTRVQLERKIWYVVGLVMCNILFGVLGDRATERDCYNMETTKRATCTYAIVQEPFTYAFAPLTVDLYFLDRIVQTILSGFYLLIATILLHPLPEYRVRQFAVAKQVCPITLEELGSDTDVVVCKMCKKIMTASAVQTWLESKETCPHCRHPWEENLIIYV